jgi:hypothetical protein
MKLSVGLGASFDSMWTGKECGREQGKLTLCKLGKQMIPVEFSVGVTVARFNK